MFRYNQTLKAFEEILEKGHFDVLNQYDTNVVWHYFKDNHNSYTEKQGNYIGHLESREVQTKLYSLLTMKFNIKHYLM